MKVYIHSCHATLEYDTAVQFKKLGWEVSGSFDVGSVERPKVEGMTDGAKKFPFEEADFVLLHQCENFPDVMEQYLLKTSKPVISHAFGQGCFAQHEDVATLCKEHVGAGVVAYSRKDYNTYKDMGVPDGQLKLIRFGKNLAEYREAGGWNGRLPICYVAHNSLPRRGEGCGWHIMQALHEMGVPVVLGGTETESLSFGLGQLSYVSMKSLFRQARCYLSLGTMPAPYTLSFMEAICAGTPLIAFDNGYGVADEGFDVILCKTAEEIAMQIRTFVDDRGMAEMESQKMIELSDREFDNEKICLEWKNFVENLI
jgi:hypothetical protein